MHKYHCKATQITKTPANILQTEKTNKFPVIYSKENEIYELPEKNLNSSS